MRATEPITASGIQTSEEVLLIIFDDRKVSIPWQKCSPKLAAADSEQRRRAELSPGGYGIHWPLIDEDLSICGLLRQCQ